jgi:hypothetical protein
MEKGRVVFCTPSLKGPTAPYLAALSASIPLITAAGWQELYVQELGNPYISAARATMTRKALDAKADVIVYLDYDVSWKPEDLLTLIETPGDVVAGLYRFKTDDEAYMGTLRCDHEGYPRARKDGCVLADKVPAGFLKVTKGAIARFMRAHPELVFGEPYNPSVDLFNHGAYEGVWYGEDYAFSRRWNALGGEIWIVPDLDISHHTETVEYPGNYHLFLQRQPGGALDPARATLDAQSLKRA